MTLIPGTSCPQQPNSFNALQGGTANGATSTWPGKLLNCQAGSTEKPCLQLMHAMLGSSLTNREYMGIPSAQYLHKSAPKNCNLPQKRSLWRHAFEVLRRDADAQQWSRALHSLCTFCSKQSGLGFQHWPSTVQENAKSFCLGRLDPQVPGVWDHRFRAYHRPHCPSRLGNASCLSYLQKKGRWIWWLEHLCKRSWNKLKEKGRPLDICFESASKAGKHKSDPLSRKSNIQIIKSMLLCTKQGSNRIYWVNFWVHQSFGSFRSVLFAVEGCFLGPAWKMQRIWAHSTRHRPGRGTSSSCSESSVSARFFIGLV